MKLGMKLVERQVIVCWHKPEEKLPEEGTFVVVSYSGPLGKNITCDHALMIGSWFDDGLGWMIEGFPNYLSTNKGTIHALADLEPYMGD